MGAIGDFSYNLFMFPFEKIILHRFRQDTISLATGKVLELGAGTGVNFKYYKKDEISSMTVLDRNLSDSVKGKAVYFDNIQLEEADAQRLPFKDKTFDTVVFTLVFCSVDDPLAGLEEVHRVLKDGGQVLFIEHVKPHGRRMQRTVDKVNPLWNSFSNGCNINRETLRSMESAGFSLVPGSYKRKGVFISGVAQKNATTT